MESRKPKDNWVNSDCHAHRIVGIWDNDNGDKSGTVCECCYRWNEFPALQAELEAAKADNNKLNSDLGVACTRWEARLTAANAEIERYKKAIGWACQYHGADSDYYRNRIKQILEGKRDEEEVEALAKFKAWREQK